MRYSSRFFLYAPFLSFVALAAGVMIWWWFAATALNSKLEAWNGHEVLPGVKLSFTSKKIAGFPFRLDTLLENVTVEVAASHGPLVWRTEHFASHMLTYGPNQFIYEAAGRQELSWHDSDGALHDFVFVPGTMRASAILSKGALARFDLDIVEIASPELGAGRAQFHVRRNPSSDALDLFLSGETIRLAPPLQAGIGDSISRLTLAARLVPATPLTSLLQGKSDWRNAVENWRVHGGQFPIDDLSVDWGGLKASGHGALALDGGHRWSGDLRLDTYGVHTLHPGAAGDAKLAAELQMTSTMSAMSEDRKFSVSLPFRNGRVFVDDTPAGSIGALY
jgi:hypothetical protein